MRVALVTSSLRGIGGVDGPTTDAVRHAAALCEALGHHVDEVDPPVPESFASGFLVYWGLLAFGLRYGGRRLFGPGFDGRADHPVPGRPARPR